MTWVFSSIGWDRNGGEASIPWALGGLAAGVCAAALIHLWRNRGTSRK